MKQPPATASFHTGRDLFRSVQAEYEEEGVPWAPIDFPDAQAALKLIEGPMGIVDVLDEECARPGGSELALVSKLKTLHDDNQRFFVSDKFSSNKFGVKHYAESVSYTVDGWCERNRDALHNDLVRLMKKSTVSALFETDDKRQKTVASKFRRRLKTLLEDVSRELIDPAAYVDATADAGDDRAPRAATLCAVSFRKAGSA